MKTEWDGRGMWHAWGRKKKAEFLWKNLRKNTLLGNPKHRREDNIKVDIKYRLRWSRGRVLAFSTQVRGFKPGRSRRIFKGEEILSTPSFGGDVKPSVPCRRFAACKRSLNGVEVVISAKLPVNILAHSSHFRRWDLSRRGGRGGIWWWKVGTSTKRGKAMASPGCRVPEPYQSPNWALISAQTGPRAEYQW